ncbi:MAG: dephospho-CoA kinase [Deltaproteobacteria bacterium]|nr:dephospho-CoA kinase [Deltaproteobacteria bacterium]
MIAGLTGGIATGKSLVSNELKRLGARIIDADIIAREIVEPGKPAYNEIVEEFGKGILNEDGTLNRRELGRIVFSDKEKLKRINGITHPGIIKRIEEEISKISSGKDDSIIVVDAAVLIEAGAHKDMDKVIVVYADEDKQIERIKRRDNLTESEARCRIGSQIPLKEKVKYADYVIDNNGRMEETLKEARELYLKLKGEKNLKKGVDRHK